MIAENSNRKHLFILVDNTNSVRYGVGTYVDQLIRCFDLEEYSINVVELFSDVHAYERIEFDGIVHYKIPFPERYSAWNWSQQNNVPYLKAVAYLLASHIPEDARVYCHSNFPYYGDLFVFFKTQRNATIILTVHYMGWSFDLLGDKEKLQQIRMIGARNDAEKRISQRFEKERAMMNLCDAIIAIAKHSYETLNSLYGIPKERLVLIPNALSNNRHEIRRNSKSKLRKSYGINDDEKIILFAGRLDKVKGVDELIEAFKLLQPTSPNTRLIMAGDGGFKSLFERINPYWGKVIFTGFISKEQLYELYSISDLGVVPSLHEEFGYVALEMIQNGLQTLVNNSTGLREIADNYPHMASTVDLSNKLFGEKVVILKDAIEKILDRQRNSSSYDTTNRHNDYDFDSFRKKIELLYREN